MIYDIFSSEAPQMPRPGKGTEFVKFILSKSSKEMRESLLPVILPAVAAHANNVTFQYADTCDYELCGQLGHLVGVSGIGKGELTNLVAAVMRKFKTHDEMEYRRLIQWQKEVKTLGANKNKPERPEIALWYPPADTTNPAFIQNAIAVDKNGQHTQYFNLPEVEMANRLCGGHRQVSQMIRAIYDRERWGALRATAEGVTGNPVLRVNMTFSSTPSVARNFYRYDLANGLFGRIPFSYKPRGERSAKIPKQGEHTEEYLRQLDIYLERVANCHGTFEVKPLNDIAKQLAEEMAVVADLADDDVIFALSHRSIVSAWKKGALLWIINNQTWTRSIGDFVRWFCYHDLWSKIQVFGDMFHDPSILYDHLKPGPKNMLDELHNPFSLDDLKALRQALKKDNEGTDRQLRVWKCRGLITYNPQTRLYTKTIANAE